MLRNQIEWKDEIPPSIVDLFRSARQSPDCYRDLAGSAYRHYGMYFRSGDLEFVHVGEIGKAECSHDSCSREPYLASEFFVSLLDSGAETSAFLAYSPKGHALARTQKQLREFDEIKLVPLGAQLVERLLSEARKYGLLDNA